MEGTHGDYTPETHHTGMEGNELRGPGPAGPKADSLNALYSIQYISYPALDTRSFFQDYSSLAVSSKDDTYSKRK